MKKINLKEKQQIPNHWNIKPFWSIATQKSIIGNEHLQLLSVYLDRGVIKFSDIKSKRTNVTSDDRSKYQKVEPGDLVMNNQQSWRGSVGISKYSGIVSPAYLIFKISKELNPEFANYLFRDKTMVEHYLVSSRGVGSIQRNIHYPSLRDIRIIFPPLKEQRIISEFLNKKILQIDLLIKKIKSKIELLKEKKTELINHFITNGLDSNVEMKSCRVEGISKIPKHWECKKLKYIVNYRKGYAFKSSLYSDSGLGLIKASDLKNTSIRNPQFFIPHKFKEDFKDVLLKKDDLIISTVGSKYEVIESAVGQIGILPKRLEGALLNQNTVCLRINSDLKIDINFIFYYLQTKSYRSHLDIHSHGTANQASLNIEDILNYELFLPSYNEQIEIINKISSDIKKIDKIISLEEKRIKTSNEYRQSLISSVVTGKIRISENMT